jgi:hypothetical protein
VQRRAELPCSPTVFSSAAVRRPADPVLRGIRFLLQLIDDLEDIDADRAAAMRRSFPPRKRRRNSPTPFCGSLYFSTRARL